MVECDPVVQGGAEVVEGVDFLNYLDRGGRERASDGPGEAGPLAAEGEGLRHGATRSVSALRRPKQKITRKS